jgi:hypothetical protein
MLLAKKANKQYKIDEATKSKYLAQGFDIYDADGNLVTRSPLTTITVAEHEKIVDEAIKKALEEAGVKSSTDPLKDMSVEELKAYAAEKNIDIGNATSVNGIVQKIKDAEKQ